ncbi:MAG: glycosyltransferase family 2 protein [Anaerolineaceae bacterium]|nr:glycosyltransferase family 2 protein [Anaerolineaceae bacterium]
MRVGQNPAKFVNKVATPERVTVAVLNYIPFLSGFYAEMLDVLKANLKSIREQTVYPFDLLVFDNGSCQEVRDYLTEERALGNIQYLILSEKNLGKGGAWNMILSGAPGEIIAYTDNDALFKKGWLEKSVKILETFPKVGMVTARPFRTPPDFYSSTLAWADENEEAELESGQIVPFETLNEFNLSLGQTKEFSRDLIEKSQDYKLTYKNISAFVGGSHWQFTAFKEVIAEFLPFEMSRPMGQVRQLDQRMNEAGFLRLMIDEPLAMNLSNSLEANKVKKADQGKTGNQRTIKERFFGFPVIKKPLLYLYNQIFNLYYRENL